MKLRLRRKKYTCAKLKEEKTKARDIPYLNPKFLKSLFPFPMRRID